MKILVTGGAGYIGSILVPLLLEQGHEVVVVDNFMYGQASLLSECINKRLTIIRGDARDKDLIWNLLRKAEAIFPLACLTGAPLCEKYPNEAKSIIFDAVKMILDYRSSRQVIIYPNTNSGYGVGEQGTFCTEDSPLRPASLYGRLKVEIEREILSKENVITFRLATVFGMSPRMRLDLLVNDFVYRAVNDRFVVLFEPHFKRNYIHVRDVARSFPFALENFDLMKNQTYNVGLSTANLSKWELCQKIKEKLPDFYFVEAGIGRDPDMRNYIVSNEKIERAGFRTQYSLEEGVDELIKGYQVVRRNQYSNI